MNFNTNFEPHLSALLFLGTAGSLLVLTVASIVFVFSRRQLLRYSVGAMIVLVIGYAALLLGFSGFSHDRTLSPGDEKYFCELDCHLAYSVQQVQRFKQIGDTTPGGQFYVVTVRTRFDEKTIASWRGNGPYSPSPPAITVVDERGREIPPSAAGQAAWNALHGASHPLSESLRPGESYETTLVFDIPKELQRARLLATFEDFPTPFLIGDEGSLLHKKTYFEL